MTEITLKIDELKPSSSNVRPSHTKEDIAMMANSIKSRGIINPPSVAKSNGKFEIIAGRLRYEGAKKAGVKEIRCIDVTALNESQRIEISLSENVDRRRMTSMQYHTAFSKLYKSGMAVPVIASRFDKSEREVQQILAIGGLPKKIIALAENNEIGDRTLQMLAIAAPKDVARFSKLTAKSWPKDWEMQEWLAGPTGMFLQSNAYFDIDEYKGPKIVDMFDDDDVVWLTDGAQFMDLQKQAVSDQVDALEKKGWKVTLAEYFESWAYTKAAKADGGQVIYTFKEKTGVVRFYVGYKRGKAAGKLPAGKNKKAEKKPDTSKAFDAYMAETRHGAVARHMLDDKTAGLVGTLIILLKQCDNVQFRRGAQLVKGEAYCDSLNEGDNHQVIKSDFAEMISEIGYKQGQLLNAPIEELGKKLLKFTTPTLQQWIVTVVAASWEIEYSPINSDAIGKVIGLDQVKMWKADDAFWNGISKSTLIKIAKKSKIAINEKATGKIIRAILKEKIPATWRPDWLKF